MTKNKKIKNAIQKNTDAIKNIEEKIQKIKIVDDNELSLKEIRETFYHCRDFEITNLWQRSVFLFGFILACFTGYGAILVSLLTTGEQKVAYPYFANFIECMISLVGIVFSVIWIMMSKGSKAWYEIYEKAIANIEHSIKDSTIFIEVPKEYKMGNYCKQYNDHINNNILSTQGGKYSPSKLNIFIGQVLLVIWSFCFIGHIIVLLYKSKCFEWINNILKSYYEIRYICFFALGIILLLILVFCLLLADVRSSTIKEI